MTVSTIEAVRKLIEELEGRNIAVNSAWEYTNTISREKMFAVYTYLQYCDINESKYVKDPKLIWKGGKFIGDYAYLNEDQL